MHAHWHEQAQLKWQFNCIKEIYYTESDDTPQRVHTLHHARTAYLFSNFICTSSKDYKDPFSVQRQNQWSSQKCKYTDNSRAYREEASASLKAGQPMIARALAPNKLSNCAPDETRMMDHREGLCKILLSPSASADPALGICIHAHAAICAQSRAARESPRGLSC